MTSMRRANKKGKETQEEAGQVSCAGFAGPRRVKERATDVSDNSLVELTNKKEIRERKLTMTLAQIYREQDSKKKKEVSIKMTPESIGNPLKKKTDKTWLAGPCSAVRPL